MSRFVEWFVELQTNRLVDVINEYATRNDLKIISLSTDNTLNKAVVLFEGKKPMYKW